MHSDYITVGGGNNNNNNNGGNGSGNYPMEGIEGKEGVINAQRTALYDTSSGNLESDAKYQIIHGFAKDYAAKMDGGKVKYILLKSPGDAFIDREVSDEEILEGIGACL